MKTTLISTQKVCKFSIRPKQKKKVNAPVKTNSLKDKTGNTRKSCMLLFHLLYELMVALTFENFVQVDEIYSRLDFDDSEGINFEEFAGL